MEESKSASYFLHFNPLLLFVILFDLLPIPRLSLALRLTFFLELKCTESAYVWLTPQKRYINISIFNSIVGYSCLSDTLSLTRDDQAYHRPPQSTCFGLALP